MKKSFISLGLIVAATFALTNCAKEFENPSQQPESAGIPFEITASAPDTKTANDGLNTVWVAGDAINLFHAVADAATYVNDGEFTVAAADVDAGRFTGDLGGDLEAGKSYDWYALYPYSEYIATPGEKDSGFTYIGHSGGLYQTGYDNMASLKGSVCPLYGIAEDVAAGQTPSVTMNHLSSVIAINVTNKNDEPLTVTTASFTATEDIVGSYFIDVTKSPVVYTPKTAQNTATVTVSEGTALAKDESAVLYLAIKPFKAAKDAKLYMSVNGYSKELVLPKDVTFAAGKIKTLNFGYDKAEDPTPEGVEIATISFTDDTQRTSYSTEQQVWENEGVTLVNNKAESSTDVNNSTNPARFYKNSEIAISAPGYITKIEFNSAPNSGDKTYFTDLKSVVGTYTEEGNKVIVELPGNSSKITYSLTSGQVRLYSVTVTYSTVGYVPPVVESISVSGYKTEFVKGETFSFGGIVTANYNDESTKDVTASSTFTGYNMSSAGTQTVTVTYEEFSTTYQITVSEPVDPYTLYSGALTEGEYIIVYNGAAMKAAVNGDRLSYEDVTISNGTIYGPDNSVVWQIKKSGEYWTIYNASVGMYAASTGAKNKAQLLSSGTDDKSLWTASGTATYEFVNKANEAAGVNKNLRRNGNYGFACYATGTGGALTLYKKN